MSNIDHTQHSHPATPAGRRACRKVTAATAEREAERKALEARFDADQERMDLEASKMGRKPSEWSGEAKAATTWVYPADVQPIKIHFILKNGKTCKVIFDQYQNPSLFMQAKDNGWDRTRTVNQAISEAINGVFTVHGIGTVETYHVEA